MRYYAMINGERRGPFDLSELPAARVRPDTYVWCKDMDDWEKAEDVADICRFFRQRIFGLMHPSAVSHNPQPSEETSSDNAGDFNPYPRRFGQFLGNLPEDTDLNSNLEAADPARPPVSLLAISVILTLLCFPVTGFVAIYYSVMTRKAWEESSRSDSKSSKGLYTEEERQKYRMMAHDYARQTKMWCGITFFLGFILYAILYHIF